MTWPSDNFSLICDWITIVGFLITLWIAYKANKIAKRVEQRVRLPELSSDIGKLVTKFTSYDQSYQTSIAAIVQFSGTVRGKLLSIHGRLDQRESLRKQIVEVVDLLDLFGQNQEYSKYVAICSKLNSITGQLADRVKDQPWENV